MNAENNHDNDKIVEQEFNHNAFESIRPVDPMTIRDDVLRQSKVAMDHFMDVLLELQSQ